MKDDPSSNNLGFMVTLRNVARTEMIRFPITPTVTESRSTSYDSADIHQLPGEIITYKSTSTRSFTLGDVKLVSRTPYEARANLERINILRGWQMPYFGSTGLSDLKDDKKNESDQAVDKIRTTFRRMLGAPPEVLHLYAYASGTDDKNIGNINGVPVVLEQLTITYPNDVDYIPCYSNGSNDPYGGTPFPVIMTIGSITLKEIHSPREFEKFKLEDYKKGRLPRF